MRDPQILMSILSTQIQNENGQCPKVNKQEAVVTSLSAQPKPILLFSYSGVKRQSFQLHQENTWDYFYFSWFLTEWFSFSSFCCFIDCMVFSYLIGILLTIN